MSGSRPPAVLGMTLYNRASYLREALDSLLAQTAGDFALLLLDDASHDETEQICREYEQRDARVRYFRHTSRQAMVATWREVVELAGREYPDAPYFAWASDHDRWHPDWLRRMLSELAGDPNAVLAYPIAGWIDEHGRAIEKGGRRFDTTGCEGVRARWDYFCRYAVGAGNMVYGLMRIDALRRAGVFRRVLRPDRLLVAEMVLQGGIRQVPETLWFRRQGPSSMARQPSTLVLPDRVPYWLRWPASIQHTTTLHAEYSAARLAELGLSRAAWLLMLSQYQIAYAWRHTRKSQAADAMDTSAEHVRRAMRGARRRLRQRAGSTLAASRSSAIEVDRWWRKAKRRLGTTVRRTEKGLRREGSALHGGALSGWASMRRIGRRALYEALMLTHRAGLRGGNEKAPR